MMMTRFVLTLLIGLVVSLGALVSGGSGVAWAGNWNLSDTEKAKKKFADATDDFICHLAYDKSVKRWRSSKPYRLEVAEAKRRGLNCDVGKEPATTQITLEVSDEQVCKGAIEKGASYYNRNKMRWRSLPKDKVFIEEAKRRGLSCGVGRKSSTQTASAYKPRKLKSWNLSDASDAEVCSEATVRLNGQIDWREDLVAFSDPKTSFALQEAKRRGLRCGVNETASNTTTVSSRGGQTPIDKILQTCHLLQTNPYKKREFEKKNRVICNERLRRYNAAQKFRETSFVTRDIERGLSNSKNRGYINDEISLNAESIISRGFYDEKYICKNATFNGQWYPLDSNGNGVSSNAAWNVWYLVARYRGLSCGVVGVSSTEVADTQKDIFGVDSNDLIEAFLGTTVPKSFASGRSNSSTQTASAPTLKAKPKVTSAALTAAEKETERLRQELAALRAEKAKQQKTISSDTKLPTITIASASSNGPQGTVKGRVTDNTGIAEVRVDGRLVGVDKAGNFMANTYVPEGGVSMSIQAIDLAGLSSSMSVRIDRAAVQTAAFRFDRLNPLGRKVARNKDAVAIIVGVSDYKETTARAAYADSDAKVFQDYAIEKLGVPRDRIKTLVNDGADESGMLLAVKRWLARASKQGKSDVYVFFAGHGLASDNGEKMYLLPYDGSPELLDDTAILRERLFADIASANPRSVTVFLDTCYSGTTRGTDMLIASRPIAIKALEQSIPDNFTVMTAARGDQTAKPLEEAKHGMFSYFLMKGMEGEADQNQDNKITAGELHQYVQSNVVQQSSGSQTPELQGDAERVLVRFQ